VTYILVGETERKTQLRRPRNRWEDNNKICLKEVGSENVDWIIELLFLSTLSSGELL
jgi:hypothetical protein